jgi:hypothetical protein
VGDHDLIETWVESCCYDVAGSSTKAVELWQAYQQWSAECSARLVPRETFYRRLSKRWPIAGSPRKVEGLLLRDEEDWEYYEASEVRRVYFLWNGKHVKIGVSQDPESRLRELQTAVSRKLELLGWVRGGFELEKELHQRFARERIIIRFDDGSTMEGEWFELDLGRVRELIHALQGRVC